MKLRNVVRGFSLGILFLNSIVFAEEPLTLDKCIELALTNSQTIKIAGQKLASAKEMKKEAFGHYLPELSVMGLFTKLSPMPDTKVSGSFMGVPFSMSTPKAFDYNYDMRLSVTQPIYTSGKLAIGNKQAELNYKTAEEELQKTKNDLVLNVKRAFYGILFAQQMVVITQEMVDVTNDHYKTTQLLYQDGKVSNYDVSRVKVQLINVQTQLIKARNGLNIAKESLFTTINTDRRDYNIAGEFLFNTETRTLDNVLQLAVSQRPELKQLQLQEEITKLLVKLTRSATLPNLALSANYDYKIPYYYDEKWDSAWNATLSFVLPLNFYNQSKVEQMKYGVEQVKLARNQVEEMIKLEAKKAFLDLNEAKERIDATKENVSVAKENLNIAKQRYKEGLMSDIEVRDVQLALTQTEMNYYQALFDYNMAQATLDKACGR